MDTKLLNLSKQLTKLGLTTEAQEIVSIAEIRPESAPVLFDMLGLTRGHGSIQDIAKAALHLSNGINPLNLFKAATSLCSTLPGMDILQKTIEEKDQMILLAAANKVLNNWNTISALISRLNSPPVKKRLNVIPSGNLLAKYSKEMSDVLKTWADTLLRNTMQKGMQF